MEMSMSRGGNSEHVGRTILCLINSAAFSRPYFEQLKPLLEDRGHKVVFAVDSHLSDVLYADGRDLEGARYFTDFIRALLPLKDRQTLATGHTWASLFSDFDRFLTMDIRPPLRAGGPVSYADVPGLLEAFFADIFSTVNPCAVVYEQVSNSFAIAANRQAIRSGVPFCSIAPARIPGRIEISLTGAIEDHVTVGRIFEQARQMPLAEESLQVAKQYIRTIDTQVPDYMKGGGAGSLLAQTSLTRRYAKREKLEYLLRMWRYSRIHRQDCELAFQHGDPLRLSWAFFKRSLRRRLREPFVKPLYMRDIDEGPFLLYPLHFHPEASTSVLAADFVDELTVIKSIAFRLPARIRLAVKEHPSAVALQPRDFYRQLSKLPNVVLLAADLPAKELARRSRGVICVTSTLGFEAAVMNRPVIALGDVLYGYFPNVRMIRDFSELGPAIDWALGYQQVPSEDVLLATAAYAEFTAPGSFDFRASLGDAAALASVANLLVERLDMHHGGYSRGVGSSFQ